MRTVAMSLLAAAALGSLSLSLAPRNAQAQDLEGQTLSYDFKQADVREALRQVFKDTKVSYTIAPDVQGSVTLAIRNVSLGTALQNITRQVGATYNVESGVYKVVRAESDDPLVPRGRPGVPFQGEAGGANADSIMIADANYLYVLRGATLWKISKASLSIDKKLNLNSN